MGSPVTFSGINGIDFNLILTSIMRQESQPLEALQTRQAALQSRANSFGVLATRVASLQQAANRLASEDTLVSFKATTSDASAVAVSTSASALPGRYEVVVNDLARAQVTASTTSAPDADTTVVATGGTITIGGVTVTVPGASTLRQLADAINATSDPPARASIVQSGPSSFRLVVSAKETGVTNAFSITNNLTGGTGIAFGDADSDGVSGDSAADNAVQATDADLLINNIPVTSTTNVIEGAIPGVTLTAFKRDPAATVVVDVAADPTALKDKVKAFISSYNDLTKFATDQIALANRGDQSSVGRDPLLAQIRNQVRAGISGELASGGAFTALSQVGVEFTRTGTLELNDAAFTAAVGQSADIAKLFAGTSGTPGVFSALDALLDAYTDGDGLLPGARTQLTEQASRLSDSILSMQERLAFKRSALQREFIAADQAMSQLKSQSGSLASIGAAL